MIGSALTAAILAVGAGSAGKCGEIAAEAVLPRLLAPYMALESPAGPHRMPSVCDQQKYITVQG